MRINAFVLLALVALSGVLLGYSAVSSFHYVEDDPRFCKTCHLMEEAWIKWNESPHRGINCHECHKADLASNMRLLVVYFTSHPEKLPEEIPEHVKISNERCEQCHFTKSPKWPYVAATAGHQLHLSKGNIKCLDCHGGRIHKFIPSNKECLKCHSDKVVKIPQMRFHCTQCHNFLANVTFGGGGVVTIRPTKLDCMKCHTTKTTILRLPMNAHAKSECSTCHQPHVDSEPLTCNVCHEVPRTAIHEKHNGIKCTDCHIPHKSGSIREDCMRCHPDKINHNPELECNVCHR